MNLRLLPPAVGIVLVVSGAYAIALSGSTYYPDTTGISDVLTISLMSGLFAASTIEVVKRLSKVRGRFHRNEIIRWLGEGAAADLERLLSQDTRLTDMPLVNDSILHAVERRRYRISSVLDLPLEQLSARIASSLSQAVLGPMLSPRLAYALVPPDIDVDGLLRRALSRASSDGNAPSSMRRIASEEDLISEAGKRKNPFDAKWSRMRGQIEVAAQDQLDAFQLHAGHEWRRSLSWWSVFSASASSLMLALLISPSFLLPTVLVSPVIGAFVSWFARDLTALVERGRRR